MRRLVLAIIVVLAFIPTVAPGQGFLDGGMLGPYFGSWGASSFGACNKTPPLAVYVGYSSDPGNTTGFSAAAERQGLNNLVNISQNYAVRGVWLGASKTVAFSDNIGVVGSFWSLFPDKTVSSLEHYFTRGVGRNERTWDTNTQWWYADLLGAYGSLNGFALLAGFRYDFLTTRFSNPFHASFPASRRADTADVTSQGRIPLVGCQVAYSGSSSSLLFRLVGFPTLAGRLTYKETLQAFRIESAGDYKGGYFVEALTEYAYVVNRMADLGLFARFSTTRGNCNLNVDLAQGAGVVGAHDTFQVGVYRNDWVVGGRITLRF